MKTEEDYLKEYRQMCDARKPKEDDVESKPDTSIGPCFWMFGASLGIKAQALRFTMPDTPQMICQEMKLSDNADIRCYGYRLEAAMSRQQGKGLHQ